MVHMRLAPYQVLAFILLLVALGCGGGNAETGTITFECDPTIPEGAVLTVELRDVSYQDASTILIASQTIENP